VEPSTHLVTGECLFHRGELIGVEDLAGAGPVVVEERLVEALLRPQLGHLAPQPLDLELFGLDCP
jgi:hypothetical protein